MQRPIVGYHQDEVGDWVAELSCGHGQHVRHKPPFWSRPWVTTPEGRAEKLGAPLDCVLCDRLEMPAGFVRYKTTPELDQDTIPAGLRAHHSTKRGVWGRIRVIEGTLRYVVEPPLAAEHVLDREHPGTVAPEVLHHVAADGAVRFYVEFYRAPEPS